MPRFNVFISFPDIDRRLASGMKNFVRTLVSRFLLCQTVPQVFPLFYQILGIKLILNYRGEIEVSILIFWWGSEVF